ncbi:DUF6731 family protein [Guyparkeria sp. TX1]|uniref:DUF6731 family protein n=1 Tax=Guyparkeria sp. TX1 TaxID=3115001 RepID=UPI003977C45E
MQLYKAQQPDQAIPLEQVIERISGDKIEDRLRVVADKEIRLDDVTKGGTEADPYWVMDFSRLRFDHGPGKAHRMKKTEGFPLKKDEGFGEQTAALYLPKTGHLIVQYNHFGPRVASIENYFNIYFEGENCACDFQVIYDKSVEQRLLKKEHFSSFTVGMAISKVTAADRENGLPLEEAITAAGQAGANNMEVRFSMGPGQHDGLETGFVKSALDGLNQLLGRNKEAVRKAEFAGKEDNESRMEIINLIKPTLTVDFTDLESGEDRRYPVADRWDRLHRARAGWSEQIKNTT